MTINELGLFINSDRQWLLANAMTFSGNKFDAEDLVSEMTLKAMRYVDNLKDGDKTSVRKWLYNIMKTIYFNLVRDAHEMAEDDEEVLDACNVACGEFESSDLGFELRDALDKLDTNQRQILELVAYGYSMKEIAEKLNCALSAAYYRLYKSQTALKALL